MFLWVPLRSLSVVLTVKYSLSRESICSALDQNKTRGFATLSPFSLKTPIFYPLSLLWCLLFPFIDEHKWTLAKKLIAYKTEHFYKSRHKNMQAKLFSQIQFLETKNSVRISILKLKFKMQIKVSLTRCMRAQTGCLSKWRRIPLSSRSFLNAYCG